MFLGLCQLTASSGPGRRLGQAEHPSKSDPLSVAKSNLALQSRRSFNDFDKTASEINQLSANVKMMENEVRSMKQYVEPNILGLVRTFHTFQIIGIQRLKPTHLRIAHASHSVR